jgi:hypothetical protein
VTLRFIVQGRTKFPSTVKDPKHYKGFILKRASTNSKLGKGSYIIKKGPWKDWPLFYLTLEERKTCPPCHHWDNCYGNNMYLAHRFKYGPDLISKLKQEIHNISLVYDNFAIRLHVLGDFPDASYVKFWGKMLEKYSGLHVFGYTSHSKGTVFNEILELIRDYDSRFCIRFSTNNRLNNLSSTKVYYAVSDEYTKPSVICPEQTGQTNSCLTCSLCFNSNFTKPIKFLTH